MNISFLDSMISPVTGRILSEPDYVLLGDRLGIATPSPMLIDMRLELLELKKEVNEITPLSDLAYKHLWIGDQHNNAKAVETIDIDNMPELGQTSVPTPTGEFVGQIWAGTKEGRPEVSNILGEVVAEVELMNEKLLTGSFVMNSGLIGSYPKAQFLSNLPANSLLKTDPQKSGKLESIELLQGQLLIGGENNAPLVQERIGITNLPNLTSGKVWRGNAENIPEEVDMQQAPNSAKYILQQAEAALPNAQSLAELSTGLLKSTTVTGVLSIASGGGVVGLDDYVTPAALEEAVAEIEGEIAGLETEIAAMEGEIAAASEIATDAVAGLEAEIIGLELQKESKTSHNADISALNSRIDNLSLSLTGDMSGSGKLSSTISTNFASNPVFTGTASMTLPVGTTQERPETANIGMIRQNSDTGALENYNGTTWVSTAGSGTVTEIDTGTGLTGGPITKSGTIALSDTGVEARTYSYPFITVDKQGRITYAFDGVFPVINIFGTDNQIIANEQTEGNVTLSLAEDLKVPGNLTIPVGTTEQRPLDPVIGMIRFNSETAKLEVYSGSDWIECN